MARTSFICNSLMFKHIFKHFFSSRKSKGDELFRNELAGFFGIEKEAIFIFGAARMSIYSLIKAMGWEKGDEVIVAGYTCVVVTNAISYSGLEVRYADIDENTLNISTTRIEEQITDKTRAVIVTHNFGIPYRDIDYLKEKYPEIFIVEDAAHTLGSKDEKGRMLGTIGDVSFFSLEYSKPITTGMGGFCLVNNRDILTRFTNYYSGLKEYPSCISRKIKFTLVAHLLTSPSFLIWVKWPLLRVLRILGTSYKTSDKELRGELPDHYPVRLNKSLSLFGYLQMRDINTINSIKSDISRKYTESLKDINGIVQYYSPEVNYVRFPLVFKEDVPKENIERIKADLLEIGIAPGEWFNDVVHPSGSFRYCYVDGLCPKGESVSKRILNLPVNIHYRLQDNDYAAIRRIFLQNLD